MNRWRRMGVADRQSRGAVQDCVHEGARLHRRHSMRFAYEIYPEKKLIVARYAGVWTLADLTAMAQRLWSDARYSRHYNGVIDLTDSKVGVTRGDFQALMEFIGGHKDTSEGRWAAVATSPLATACGLLYKRSLARRHGFEVFSTIEAAGAFVGVELSGELWPDGAGPRAP